MIGKHYAAVKHGQKPEELANLSSDSRNRGTLHKNPVVYSFIL